MTKRDTEMQTSVQNCLHSNIKFIRKKASNVNLKECFDLIFYSFKFSTQRCARNRDRRAIESPGSYD